MECKMDAHRLALPCTKWNTRKQTKTVRVTVVNASGVRLRAGQLPATSLSMSISCAVIRLSSVQVTLEVLPSQLLLPVVVVACHMATLLTNAAYATNVALTQQLLIR